MTGRDRIDPGQPIRGGVNRPGEDELDQNHDCNEQGRDGRDSEIFEQMMNGRTSGTREDWAGRGPIAKSAFGAPWGYSASAGARDDDTTKPGEDDGSVDAAEAATALSGDQILRGMAVAPSAQAVGTASPSAPEPSSGVSEVIEKIADQVLVSKPDAQNTEIRVKLKSSLLEGAEVSLQREPGGGLLVKFDTSSYAAAQRIDGFSEHLKQHMESRTSQAVRVVVHTQTESQTDGRSRNRRDPWDIDAEDAE